LPDEGKTSTAIALARRGALLGDKVLLIDCDFRKPRASQQLGHPLTPGISEILAKEVTADEAVRRDEKRGFYFLTPGSINKDPLALLGSEGLRDLLKELKAKFDVVIFDSSPILAVAEVRILARIVDQTVVLVKWGETPRQTSMAAVKQLQDFKVRMAGIALTQVDLTKQSNYGYGEYGYYTSEMKGYYTN
jgi:capsular exopolysaccharide synthesis family protein